MPYFPQINSNMIITQLPYTTGQSYETVIQDLETGARYSYPRIDVGLDNFPTDTMSNFQVNYTSITDAEVATLLTFFRARKGRYGSFRFLDPGGNLVQYSEDFSQAYWDKSNGPVTVGSHVTDPFGGNLATALTGTGSNAYVTSVVGPSDGGLNGVRVTASAWIKTPDTGAQLLIGFIDSGFAQLSSTNYSLPVGQWKRISHSATLWDDNYFRVILGGNAAWAGGRIMNVFGVQVTPMKGEGSYVKTPGNYGYHENCRFDTDTFDRKVVGPNQNSLLLPIAEFNV